MKIDCIEIFQTVRAILQPHTTKGFVPTTNSETLYNLWSDKQLDVNSDKIINLFFASIKIINGIVEFYFFEEFGNKNYKQKGWV